MNKVIVALLITVLLVFGGVYYYYDEITEHLLKEESKAFLVEGAEVARLEKLSETITYDAPGTEHTATFSVFIDDAGIVQGVEAANVGEPSHQKSLNTFSSGLIEVIGGKKLNELEAVDKVGTATLTTDAFNDALESLKSR